MAQIAWSTSYKIVVGVATYAARITPIMIIWISFLLIFIAKFYTPHTSQLVGTITFGKICGI